MAYRNCSPYTDEEMEIRAELGECTMAGDHEVTHWGTCIHCGAEFPVEDDED